MRDVVRVVCVCVCVRSGSCISAYVFAGCKYWFPALLVKIARFGVDEGHEFRMKMGLDMQVALAGMLGLASQSGAVKRMALATMCVLQNWEHPTFCMQQVSKACAKRGGFSI